ncbi:hypothetical protein BCV72DRAFT_207318 [Rhizopus microsporus var. microsporus]|uniref:Uncharacterized protein n=1 Tax=Rhizopus microsporus var. microsporus TaxID=86635 RepID=A0A1X0R3C0_RHIZD|nr:hypothetical protein BCV72DRAFT_207318 [Rhizopus microsporus var. microsporus]
MDFLQQSNKLSIRKNYDLQWRRWASWCLARILKVNSLEHDPVKLVEFLIINKDLSPQQLNCIRLAVASVFRAIHPDKPVIASSILLQQYFQSKRRNYSKLPNNSQEVYDVQPILNMVQAWGKTSNLGLDILQQKTILLVTIASIWRPRSDIGKLQYRDIIFKHDDQGLLLGVTLIARSPKETDTKTSKPGTLEDKENCPVYTLYQFWEHTLHLRSALPEDHSLFFGKYLRE